jgi:heme exporter protein D
LRRCDGVAVSVWLALIVTVAALVVGYVFGVRQSAARVSLPELARLWERRLSEQQQGNGDDRDVAQAYRQGLRDMARALVIGDPPPPSDD